MTPTAHHYPTSALTFHSSPVRIQPGVGVLSQTVGSKCAHESMPCFVFPRSQSESLFFNTENFEKSEQMPYIWDVSIILIKCPISHLMVRLVTLFKTWPFHTDWKFFLCIPFLSLFMGKSSLFLPQTRRIWRYGNILKITYRLTMEKKSVLFIKQRIVLISNFYCLKRCLDYT